MVIYENQAIPKVLIFHLLHLPVVRGRAGKLIKTIDNFKTEKEILVLDEK